MVAFVYQLYQRMTLFLKHSDSDSVFVKNCGEKKQRLEDSLEK